jgi:hypothetical protein
MTNRSCHYFVVVEFDRACPMRLQFTAAPAKAIVPRMGRRGRTMSATMNGIFVSVKPSSRL